MDPAQGVLSKEMDLSLVWNPLLWVIVEDTRERHGNQEGPLPKGL